MQKRFLLKFKRIFLILFVFSLPFEYWDPFGIASFFSVTKMVGFGYAGMALLTIKESFDKHIFKYVRYLIIFWLWLVLLSMFNYIGTNTVSVFNLTLFQNIIFYWLIASDLKKQNIQVKSIMLSFVLSILLITILLNLGIGLEQEYVEGISRISFFGNNPNIVGVLNGLALVFSLYFVLNPAKTYGKKSFLALLAIPGFVGLLLLSGSRGALITTALSIALMLIMNKTVPYKRMLQLGLLIVAASFFMEKLVESELMYNRVTAFIDEGNIAGRGEIWENVLEISSHSPLMGYGTTGFENEMIKMSGGYSDAHNLFLYILVTTGIIGLSLFLYFLYFHLKKAIQALRQGNVLKIILLIFYLTTVLKAGGVINDKLMWLLLAIIFSATFIQSQKKLSN